MAQQDLTPGEYFGPDIEDEATVSASPEVSTERTEAPALLDSSATSWLRFDWETIAWIALLIVAAVTRFYNVGVRAMSHDESLHTFYSHGLYNAGNYSHNPMMHGPFLFHVNALFYSLFGVNDATSRIGPALAGIGVVAMAYFFRRYIGRRGALLAGVLLTVSPSLLFHSRYIRNDIYIALFTLIWIYGAFRYLDTRRARWLTMMVLGMALGFITKENHFIGGAILGAFFAALALWQSMGRPFFLLLSPLLLGGGIAYYFHMVDRDDLGLIALGAGVIAALAVFLFSLRDGSWGRLRRTDSGDLAIVMLTLVMPFTAPVLYLGVGPLLGWEILHFGDWQSPQSIANDIIIRYGALALALTGLAALLAWYWFGMRRNDKTQPPLLSFGLWAQQMGLFWLIQILFFTTFFTNFRNGMITGVIGSLGYWIAQQEVARGGQPDYYYFLLTALYEFLPALLSLLGMAIVGLNLWNTSKWEPALDLPDNVLREEEALQAGAMAEEAETVHSVALTTDSGPEDRPGVVDPEAVSAPVAPQSIESSDDVVAVAHPAPTVVDLLRQNRVFFAVFGVWWIVASWLAYSEAGEKMPWLLTHLALPMCLFGGWLVAYVALKIDWRTAWRTHAVWLIGVTPAALFLLGTLITNRPGLGRDTAALAQTTQFMLALLLGAGLAYLTWRWSQGVGWGGAVRLLAIGFFSLLFLLTIRFSYMLTFVNYDMATEYLVYAHASPDIKRMLNEIDLISERTVGDRNLEVAYDNDTSWPLSWYMLAYPNSRYYGETPNNDAMDAPVIIVGPENYDKVHPYVTRDYVKREYRLIWWPDQGYFNRGWRDVWNTVQDPDKLADLWQIFFYRRHPDDDHPSGFRDLTEWPMRHDYEMWVQRDIAAEIWDLGVAPIVGSGTSAAAQLRASELDHAATMVYADQYDDLGLNRPRGVATDLDGVRYIADTLNHRIVVLEASGALRQSFGSFCDLFQGEASGCVDPDGEGPLALGDGQFNEPWGVAVDPDGMIYVADTWNHRVQVFDGEGQFVRKWGYFSGVPDVPGDSNALYGPRGIAADPNGTILLADTGNKRIIRYGPGGEDLGQIGGGGVIGGRFDEPSSVAVDPRTGDVFVADNWNRRIQKLTPDLTFIEEWLVPGWETQLRDDKPGVAVDATGRVYATDPTMYRVIVFSPEGEIQSSFGAYGVESNQMAFPNGIAIDGVSNEILVADADNNRVMLFPPLPE